MIFKNCESLYYIPVTYMMLYIYYTSIKKKKGMSIFRNRGTGSLECCLVKNLQSGHSKETKRLRNWWCRDWRLCWAGKEWALKWRVGGERAGHLKHIITAEGERSENIFSLCLYWTPMPLNLVFRIHHTLLVLVNCTGV